MESSARNKRKLSNITLIKEKTLFFSLQISMDILFIFIAEIWNFSLAMDITYFKNRVWNVYRSATSKQAVIYVNLFRFLNRVIILFVITHQRIIYSLSIDRTTPKLLKLHQQSFQGYDVWFYYYCNRVMSCSLMIFMDKKQYLFWFLL